MYVSLGSVYILLKKMCDCDSASACFSSFAIINCGIQHSFNYELGCTCIVFPHIPYIEGQGPQASVCCQVPERYKKTSRFVFFTLAREEV